ncbi:MAG: M56 family metallopeptidase [Wujia sp.]
MNWINVLAESLLISSVAQISVGLLWMVIVLALGRNKNARVLYNFQKLVMTIFIVPVGLIYVIYRYYNFEDGNNIFPDVNRQITEIHSVVIKWYLILLLFVVLYQAFHIVKLVIRCGRRLPEDKRLYDILETVKTRLGIRRKIRIRQGMLIDSPFIVGMLRPCIYLPPEELTDEELDIVLQHELYHYKQRDTIWKPLMLAICTIYYFNPISWMMFVLFRAFSEISCDYRCCCNEMSNKTYFSAILGIAEKVTRRTTFFLPNWFDGKAELKWRIRFMKKYFGVKSSKLAVAMVALITVAAGSITVSAAEKKIENIYNSWDVETSEEICIGEAVAETDGDELVLHMETEDDDQGLLVVEEQEPLVSLYLGAKNINWTVEPGVRMLSALVSCTAGGYINIIVDITPSNKTVKVGVRYPDGTMYYVNGSGRITYTFNIPAAGQYRYYITNNNDVTITATGTAVYK